MSTTNAVNALLDKWSEPEESQEETNPEPEQEVEEVEVAPEQLESVEPDSGEPTRYMIDELLEDAEINPEDVYMRVTVDGEPMEVPYGEARNGYSREADYRRNTQALADERRQHQEEWQAKLNEMQEWSRVADSQDAQLDQWLMEGQQALESQFGQAMRQAQAAGDTTQFLALKVERDDQERLIAHNYQQQKANLQAARQQVSETWDRQVNDQREKCDLKLRQTWDRCTSEQALLERKQEISKFVSEEFGIPEEQSLKEVSPVLWQMAYDAMRYRQAKKGIKANAGNGPTLSGGVRRTSSELAVKGAKRKARELQEKQRKTRNARDNMSAAQDRLAHQFAQSDRGRARRGLS